MALMYPIERASPSTILVLRPVPLVSARSWLAPITTSCAERTLILMNILQDHCYLFFISVTTKSHKIVNKDALYPIYRHQCQCWSRAHNSAECELSRRKMYTFFICYLSTICQKLWKQSTPYTFLNTPNHQQNSCLQGYK